MLTGRIKLSLAMLLTMGMVAFGAGCSENEDALTPDQASIESEIEQDWEALNLDLMDEDSENSVDGGFAKEVTTESVDAAINPLAYWRRVRVIRQGLDIQISEDGQTAVATLRFRLLGRFVIVVRDTVTNHREPIFKDLDHLMERKVRFVRNQDTTAERRWIRDGFTPAYGISNGGTMALTGTVTITITDSMTGEVTTYAFSNPLEYYFTFASLPKTHPGDVVRIEVPIANSDADDEPLGKAHRARHPGHPLSRLFQGFNDDGLFGDTVADDGIYTTQWRVPNNGMFGIHLGVIDFITTSTAYDDVAPYNSLVVSFPFHKNAQE